MALIQKTPTSLLDDILNPEVSVDKIEVEHSIKPIDAKILLGLFVFALLLIIARGVIFKMIFKQ